MLKSISIFVAAAIGIAATFWILEYSFSNTFQTCIGKYTDAHREKAAEKNQPPVPAFLIFDSHARCTIRLLSHHHGVLTALATLLIAAFTAVLWWATERTAQNFTVTERAYVKMSHASPGLIFDEAHECVWVALEIKNSGKTPATITDVVVEFVQLPKDKSLPEVPVYTKLKNHMVSEGFLVAQDFYYATRPFSFKPIYRPVVTSGEERLWVYGYVDYRDQFGVCHRAGYARLYSPHEDDKNGYPPDGDAYSKRSNLVFPPLRGWNYDRPPLKGEVREQEPEQS